VSGAVVYLVEERGRHRKHSHERVAAPVGS
jgi:hypothetical protein